MMVEFFLGSVTAEVGLSIRQKVSVSFSKVSTEGSLKSKHQPTDNCCNIHEVH